MIRLITPKIYLETTVFNYYFTEDPMLEIAKLDTIELFKEIKNHFFEAYYSDVVVAELDKCNEPKRSKMLSLIKEYKIIPIKNYNNYIRLAQQYIEERVLPKKKKSDAAHIALATINNLDIVVSWNCKHIVRYKTRKLVNIINEINGYKKIDVNTPTEVIENV